MHRVERAKVPEERLDQSVNPLLFLRHGHVDRFADRYMDEAEVTLSAQGRAEALAMRRLLASYAPDLVVVSTVRRCRETAALALDRLGTVVEYDARLRERAFPPLFGWPFSRIREVYGEVVEDRLRNRGEKLNFAGVESIESAQGRVVRSLDEHIGRSSRLAVISHGGPHSWFCCFVEGRSLDALRCYGLGTGNASRFVKRRDPVATWSIECVDASPLDLM